MKKVQNLSIENSVAERLKSAELEQKLLFELL